MNSSHPPSDTLNEHRPVPLVVQIGFAGSRTLIDPVEMPDIDPAAFDAVAFETAVQTHLTTRLQQLRTDLKLEERHFLCGISQVAIGADTLFTRACEEIRIPQRFFLPQHRVEYLSAVGSHNKPDFTEAERRIANELLDSAHVIQIHVVSLAHNRDDRFKQTNIEIVRESDVVVCLVRADATAKPGGTGDMLERAEKRGIPVLEIRVGMQEGAPTFTEIWHRRDKFVLPGLPEELAGATLNGSGSPGELPPVGVYCSALKSLASQTAKWQRTFFIRAAFAIISAHVLATACAVIALVAHGWELRREVVLSFVSFEFLLLATGFGVHQYLHRSRFCETWAVTRLVAELTRSVDSVGPMHVYLSYLFELPFPIELRPLLRTINVLHLRTTNRSASEDWKTWRDAYVEKRLTHEIKGQLFYYEGNRDRARGRLDAARKTFVWATILALVATGFKFLFLTFHKDSPGPENPEKYVAGVLGGLAIFCPVVAVAALSLSAAFDLEARFHTYSQMHELLTQQTNRLRDATSEHEYTRLLLETESHLLGETANWYARRSFTGVS